MEAIFFIRRFIERYREQKNDLHMILIDLEKTYDKIPKNILWWALGKKRVSTNYVTLIKDMYINILTSVIIYNDESNVCRMLCSKRITHLQDECNQNTDIKLDM
jgi:hypothetical protein